MSEKRYICDNCKKTFTRKSGLKAHQEKKVCYDKPYRCKYCSNTFSSDSSMYRHVNHYCLIKKNVNDEDKPVEDITIIRKEMEENKNIHDKKISELYDIIEQLTKQLHKMNGNDIGGHFNINKNIDKDNAQQNNVVNNTVNEMTVNNTNNTNNIHNKKYIKLIGGGVEELDDLVQQSQNIMKETDAQIAKTESNLKEYEESKEKIEETIEIAKLSTEFLNDVSKIVNNKNKEEYETLGKQLADITDILSKYTEA